MPNIIILEKQKIVRMGLRRFFITENDINIIGEYENTDKLFKDITKYSGKSEVLFGIRKVANGGAYQSPIPDQFEINTDGTNPNNNVLNGKSFTNLTKCKTEVVILLTKGLNSKEIGRKLKISKRTVDNYRQGILRKLLLKNTNQLITFSLTNSLEQDGTS